MEVESCENGRSKRDGKHLAAENIWRKIRKLPGVSMETHASDEVGELASEMTYLNRDMLTELRDYCVRHEMPLPTIEIVQQSHKPNAPEFVACCTVASIVRYGKSDTKKDARQRAAIEILAVISNDKDKVHPSTKLADGELNKVVEDSEADRRKIFKTFTELTDAGSVDYTGLRLCDRHNYFKNFYPALKEAAFEVIRSDEYMSTKEQAVSLLSALKLTPSIEAIASRSMEPLLKIGLDCDFDCLFLGLESEIYEQIIDYFKVMLL